MTAGARTVRPSHSFLLLLLLVAFALRVTFLTEDRFHADEALYAGWALRILDDDPLLLDVPVDKPPLYLYALAASMRVFGRSEVAARLPSLAASVLGIALVYRLGRRLYDGRTGLWAALFLSLSPFDILFARTAFTDPMLVLWMLAALHAAATGRPFWAGAAAGLAFATKQHAIALIPLVALCGVFGGGTTPPSPPPPLPTRERKNSFPPWRGGTEGGERLPLQTTSPSSPTPARERENSFPPWRGGTEGWERLPLQTTPPSPPTPAKERENSFPPWRGGTEGGERLPLQTTPPSPPTPARERGAIGHLLAGVAGFALPFALVTWWDSARWDIRPGYWQQSNLSYGGLVWAEPAKWGARLVEWGTWARYLVGSPVLYVLLLAGAVVLVASGWWRRPKELSPAQPRLLDTILLGYALGYVVLHTALQFSVWDRYLLPLAPLAALLLARIMVRGLGRLRREGAGRGLRLVCASVVCLAACFSACKAALNGYPVGGEHWAYQGLDRVVAFLQENAAPDAVLYHHWLRWHYTYYLYGTDFELRWWQSAAHLRQEAMRTSGREQYIVLPDWRTLDPASKGIALVPLYETFRRDGSVSLTLYRLELVE